MRFVHRHAENVIVQFVKLSARSTGIPHGLKPHDGICEAQSVCVCKPGSELLCQISILLWRQNRAVIDRYLAAR